MASAVLVWTYRRAVPGHVSTHEFAVEVEFESPYESGPMSVEDFREAFPLLQRVSRAAAKERVQEIDDALELVEGTS